MKSCPPIILFVFDIIPCEIVFDRPRGLPIAYTVAPAFISSESAVSRYENPFPSILIRAISRSTS